MGNNNSHYRRSDASCTEKIAPNLDPINEPTLNALKAARDREGKHDLSFEKLLLKFSALEDGFDRCHEVFNPPGFSKQNQFSAGKRLKLPEARRARRQLGIQISPEEASQLFKINYEQEDQVIILFIDFIVACCIITMHKGPETVIQEGGDEDVVNMLLLAMDAFNYLDADSNGILVKENIVDKLRDVDGMAHAPKKSEPTHRGNDAISERWRFMDYDQDGRASFRDFLTSLHAWVMGDRSK